MFRRKKIIFIRVPKYFFLKKFFSGDIWAHFYGMLGVVALIMAIIYNYRVYENNDENIQKIINTLAFSITAIIFVFTVWSIYVNVKILTAKKAKNDYLRIENRLYNECLANKYLSECIHSILHYDRNINARLTQLLSLKKINAQHKADFSKRFNDYLIVLTSNLQNYFSFVTQDNCSISIKLIDESKKSVKTFFRDPINLNKRRKSDNNYESPDKKYLISDNTAFSVIMNKNYTDIFFWCNNLGELYDNHEYKNSNSKWSSLYNATIVVPISMVLKADTRDVLGFITVDNFKGGFRINNDIEFLHAIGDLLYNVLVKYKKIV